MNKIPLHPPLQKGEKKEPLKTGEKQKTRPRIIWQCDVEGWAMAHLARHIMENLPDLAGEIRAGVKKNPPVSPFAKRGKSGAPAHGGRQPRAGPPEIRVLMYVGQFKHFDGDEKTILHLDGNRWYENYGVEFDF